MKLHQTCVLLVAFLFSTLALGGCQEWRNPGPQYPARNTPDQSGMDHSMWQNTSGAPTTQPQ